MYPLICSVVVLFLHNTSPVCSA